MIFGNNINYDFDKRTIWEICSSTTLKEITYEYFQTFMLNDYYTILIIKKEMISKQIYHDGKYCLYLWKVTNNKRIKSAKPKVKSQL